MTATPEVSAVLGTLEHLHPKVLQLEDNVRLDKALTKAFIANIAENGVLVPITAVRTADGTVRVRTGQRRTLAAQEAGLPTIPVYVRDADGAYENTARLIEQIVENDHREQLNAADRVLGIQQLLDDGLSVTKVAKKLSVPAKAVKEAQAVSSQTALDGLGSGQLTLSEAAVIAEFDGDENALARLQRAAGTERFEHIAAELREDRASEAAYMAAEAGYAEQGYTVLEDQPNYGDLDAIPLSHLLKDGQPVNDTVVTDPKQWAVLVCEDSVYVDKASGEEVDERDVDWNTQGQPKAEPRAGIKNGEQVTLRHADTVVETTVYVPEFYCIDYQAVGLTPNERFARSAGIPTIGAGEGSGVSEFTVDLSDAKRASEAAEKAAQKEAAEKRERRKVLALNKLGDAALGVRREFVRTLLTRKTPPKGAAIFVARMLAGDSYLLSNYKADATTSELLGVEFIESMTASRTLKGVDKLVAELPANGDGRAQVITLGLVLGALEGRTPKDVWRQDQWSRDRGPKPYLEFLAANGYTLAPVEEIVTGKRKADKVYDQHVAEK